MLQDLEIRHLAALQAVAEEGSFGRAATRLGFTQSAISQQIAALERAVGAPVFDRPGGPKRVELTPTGAVVLRHADAILGRIQVAADDLERLRAGSAGHVTVGTFQSVSVRILPAVVKAMRAERPGVEIRLHESDEHEVLIDRLLAGALDVTFLVQHTGDERLATTDLFLDPFVAVTARTDPTAATGPMGVDELRTLPLIGEQPSSCQLLIDRGLAGIGVEPSYVFRSSDNSALQAMVRSGLGCAVMPLLAVDTEDPEVAVRPIDPPIPPRPVGIATVTGRTVAPAVERFIELTQQVSEPFRTLTQRLAAKG
ncbi:LysR substrate-binding domain-containing protein [soil metagenome]